MQGNFDIKIEGDVIFYLKIYKIIFFLDIFIGNDRMEYNDSCYLYF